MSVYDYRKNHSFDYMDVSTHLATLKELTIISIVFVMYL